MSKPTPPPSTPTQKRATVRIGLPVKPSAKDTIRISLPPAKVDAAQQTQPIAPPTQRTPATPPVPVMPQGVKPIVPVAPAQAPVAPTQQAPVAPAQPVAPPVAPTQQAPVAPAQPPVAPAQPPVAPAQPPVAPAQPPAVSQNLQNLIDGAEVGNVSAAQKQPVAPVQPQVGTVVESIPDKPKPPIPDQGVATDHPAPIPEPVKPVVEIRQKTEPQKLETKDYDVADLILATVAFIATTVTTVYLALI